MDWLKDKKNQPIVAAIAVVVILVVGFGVYWFGFRPAGSSAPPMDQTAQVDPAGGMPSGAPPAGAPATPAPGAMPGAMPGATPAASPAPGAAPAPGTAPAATPGQAPATGAAGTQVASIKPMETWRSDPFEPIGYKPVKKGKQTPPIWDFPFEPLPHRIHKVIDDKSGGKPEIQQPSRRMAGILLNNRVYAILESNGSSQVVQPGDYTTDRLAMVERIESDRVVLKTVDSKPKYVTIKMAASPIVREVTTSTSQMGQMGGPPMPMPGMAMPGMPGPRPRFPRGGM